MFNFFKKQSSSEKSDRDIVYDFVEICGQISSPILDERLLPHPKQKIIDAFMYYEAQLNVLAQYDANKRKELDLTQIMKMQIHDFQPIDKEDIQIVMEINTGPRFKRFWEGPIREDESLSPSENEAVKIFLNYVSKYQMRALRDFEQE